MTQEQFENYMRFYSAERKRLDAEAVSKYEQTVKDAAILLRSKKIQNEDAYKQAVAFLGLPERKNHEAYVRKNSHKFMRYIKKAANQFELDEKEFESFDDTIFSAFSQHFDIQPDKVTFTITCELTRKNANNNH